MLGILLVAARPMSVGEVVAELHRHGVTTAPWLSNGAPRVVADMLAYQMRAGRVRRTGPARYELTMTMSRTTEWRYRNWYHLLRAEDQAPVLGPRHSDVAVPSAALSE